MYSRRAGVVVWNLSFSRPLNDWEIGDFASLLSLLESVKLVESVRDHRVWATNSSGRFSVKVYLQAANPGGIADFPRQDLIMSSQSEDHTHESGEFSSSNEAVNRDVVEQTVNTNVEAEAKQQDDLVEWLNSMFPSLSLPPGASEEELRACLIDGTILCSILNRLSPGSVDEEVCSDLSLEPCSENVNRFLAAMDEIGLPRFEHLDLEQGSMAKVLKCLWTLKARFNSNVGGDDIQITSLIAKSGNHSRKRWKISEVERIEGIVASQGDLSSHGRLSTVSGEERRKMLPESKFQCVLRSNVMSGMVRDFQVECMGITLVVVP
ncbi:hypothetical protein HHK36_032877 [Tetracentron sinense]|uniref:Calponin-homology (CH) domain-containing protein n=1 Tax=Tetracentron sinense TaxID=13715 RepID=A0A835D017_TETSI|nr:hypothetical protein HHK36_032877 [Tetracentron sinense]